jgi:hypothetical protein
MPHGTKGMKRPGDWISPGILYLTNRTGGATAIGDVCALNFDFVNGTYNSIVVGAAASIWNNVVAVTTENAARILVVANEVIASGAAGSFTLEGICQVNQNGANAGEYLVGTNAQKYATPYTLTELDGLTVATGIVGISLEASTGAQVKTALWDGMAWKHLIGGGA